MASVAIGLRRLAQQRLAQHQLAAPEEVVGWLGAVQSQEYQSAMWSLGMRTQNAATEVIERAFADGAILRTHVLRPTWHFVTPDDIRWLLALTAPRVKAAMAYYSRRLDVDDALIAQSNAAIASALAGGQYRTRAELGAALGAVGIVAEGQRLGLLIMHAELDAVVCSGPRRGKQFTFALLAERAPQARILRQDEALAELSRRYFTSHGPATPRDFAWWSGLTVADARAGLEMVGASLGHEEIGGQTYWFSASPLPAGELSQTAFLLPTYDEFLVGYEGFATALTDGRPTNGWPGFNATIVIGARVVGNWRRTLTKGTAVIEVAPFAPLSDGEREAISVAAQRYGAFVGLPVECVGL